MNKPLLASLTLATSLLLSGVVMAQTPTDVDPGHPRVNEVQQRIDNQEKRIDNGVKDGQITPAQAGRDEARDAKVQQQLNADEAKNGGHITKAEQHKMNKELNKNSKNIHRQRKHGERHEKHEEAVGQTK